MANQTNTQAHLTGVVERLKWVGPILFWCAVAAFFVFSSLVGIYGLFIYQGDDFYSQGPWGMIAVPGYFVWMPLPFLAVYGLLKLGWALIVKLGHTAQTSDIRTAWMSGNFTAESVPRTKVLEVTAWTTSVVGVLLIFWGSPFLPSGIWFWPAAALITVATGVVLLRGWTSWQSHPYGLGRVIAGVAAGVLFSIAFAEATQLAHLQCVDGVGGRDPECFEYAEVDGPDMGNAALALLGAGALVYVAAGLKE